MIKDKTLLPLIREVINKLKEVKYFNKLDLIQKYNNIQIKEDNKWKAVFLMNKELFEPKVMYFGLYNLPEIFQRMMNSIFQELLYEGVLANYMDDFMIPAKTKKKLEERIIYFLKMVEKYNLCFKQSKCNFNTKKIPILEVIVRQEEVQIENDKIKVVKKYKTSTKTKEVKVSQNLQIFTNALSRTSVTQ